MSWQLGSFTLLGIALAAGFAWYERQRPDARIVALVGTLAAFAALGRIAFAALPNVKPTTDIVLISGFALGGGPGFAVGALAALTSNFFFGQGPWTPWQMAAWGATGVFGAALAWTMVTAPQLGRARRRRLAGASAEAALVQPRIGRWPLALVCCLAGLAFTIVQDFGDWVSFSDHSTAQLGVYVAKGLGFDAVHAAGCLGFALAFGPALTRSIQRFARRLEVTWTAPAPAVAPIVAAALLLSATAGLGDPPAAQAAVTPTSYLLAAENADGGFGAAPGQPSAELYSGWAALGLAAAGYDLRRLQRGSAGLIAYIRSGAGSGSDVGSLERTILVVRAAGLSPRSFSGRDLVAALAGRVRGNGSVAGQVNLTAFAVLALRAGGASPSARTYAWLEHQQGRDGGFSFAGAGAVSDVDDTGAVLEALAGQGGRAPAGRKRAIIYLRGQQNRDGGFPATPGAGSNAQSTAFAVQGLDAAQVDPAGLLRAGSLSPLAYLDALVASDGHVRYARGADQTPVWVTGQVLMALAGKPLPLLAAVAPVRARGLRVVRAPAKPAAPTARARVRAPRARARARRSSTSAPGHLGSRRSLSSLDPLIGRLLTGAGIATALVLAPIGLD